MKKIHWEYWFDREGTATLLGPAKGEKLNLDEEIGIGLDIILQGLGKKGRQLCDLMWKFEEGEPIVLDSTQNVALAKGLQIICDHLAFEKEFVSEQLESKGRRIVELHSALLALGDCIRDGIEDSYSDPGEWKHIAKQILRECCPEAYQMLDSVQAVQDRGSQDRGTKVRGSQVRGTGFPTRGLRRSPTSDHGQECPCPDSEANHHGSGDPCPGTACPGAGRRGEEEKK